MKKKLLMLILGGIFFLLICVDLQPQAKKVAAIVSRNAEFYTKPFEGFRESCSHQVIPFILTSNESENSRILQRARNERADLILLIGSFAASSFNPRPSGIPIIYCMILQPETFGLTGSNVTGVSLDIPVSKKLDYLKELSPRMRRIGLLYNPDNMREIAEEIAKDANARNMKLIPAEFRSFAEISSAVKGFTGKVDAIYLPKDSTLLEKKTFEYITLFSIQNRIVLFVPTTKFVKMGGFMAVDIDLAGIGRQAGITANRILAGSQPSSIPLESPKEIFPYYNPKVASLIGLEISSSFKSIAKVLE